MKIAVFCSANNSIDADFFAQTEELGHWIGEAGHTLVFGGCNQGLMECIGQAARKAGARTVGVVPRILEKGGKVSQSLEVTIPCDNLSDRKDLLMTQSDVCIALPGGIGTLDEIFTVAAGATIGYHQMKVILYNMKGFWNSAIALLDDMQQRGMIRGHWSDYILVANDLEEIKQCLTQ
jgi:uncharacterized protein (TIGR00730 family)